MTTTQLDFEVEESNEELYCSVQSIYAARRNFQPFILSREVFLDIFPWYLCNRLQDRNNSYENLTLLRKQLARRTFQSFSYFFEHNDNKEMCAKLLDIGSTSRKIFDELFIFFCLKEQEFSTNKDVQNTIFSNLKLIASRVNEFSHEERAKKYSIPWLLLRQPFFASHLMNQLIWTQEETERNAINQLLSWFPLSFFEEESHSLKFHSHFRRHLEMQNESFFHLLQDRVEHLSALSRKKMSFLLFGCPSLSSDTNTFPYYEIIFRKHFHVYLKETDVSRSLEEDLSTFYCMYYFNALPLVELLEIFCTRWRGTPKFFNEVGHCFCDPFLFFFPEKLLTQLTPSNIVGSAVFNFIKTISGLSSKSKNFSSKFPRLLSSIEARFGKILSSSAVNNDAAIPLQLLDKSDPVRRGCALSYLYNAFLHFHVYDYIKSTSSLMTLMSGENLRDADLFLQCLEYFENGAFYVFDDTLVSPKQDPLLWNLHELNTALAHKENLSLLCQHSNKFPSVLECENIEKNLQYLDQLSVIRHITFYFPQLTEVVLEYLRADKSWLSELRDKRWLEVPVQDLLRCSMRVDSFQRALSPQFSELLGLTDTGTKSFLLQRFAKEITFSPQAPLSNSIEQVSNSFKLAEQNLCSFLENVQAESITVNKVRSILFLQLEKGNSFAKEIELLSLCGVCSALIHDTKKEQITANFRIATEYLTVFDKAAALFCPLTPEKSVLQYFSFGCYIDGTCDDSELSHISALLSERAPFLEEMKVEDLKNFMEGNLSCITNLSSNKMMIVRLLTILKDLHLAEHIWTFFNEQPNFVGEDGLYTREFEDEVDVRVRKEKEEVREALEGFKFLSPFVLIIRHESRKKSILECLLGILTNSICYKHLQASEEDWTSFVEKLQHVNGMMKIVKNAIDKVEDQLEIVLKTYREVNSGFTFVFDLLSSQVSMSFYRQNAVQYFSHDECHEFLMLLRFVAQENKVQAEIPESSDNMKISNLLLEIDHLYRIFPTLQELYSAGCPKISFPKIAVRWKKSPPLPLKVIQYDYCELSWVELKNLPKYLEEWNQELQCLLRENPWISLLSTSVARRLSIMLNKNDDDSVRVVYNVLSNFFAFRDDTFLDFKERVHQVLQSQATTSTHWLVFFIDCVKDTLKCFIFPSVSSHSLSVRNEESESQSTLFHCQSDAHTFAVLHEIYKIDDENSRLFPFQLFWCSSLTSTSSVRHALQKVRLYPGFIFTFIWPDLLTFSQQELILAFLQDLQKVSNLRFITCTETMLRLSEHVKEGSIKPTFTLQEKKLQASTIKSEILISCFSGPSGSGKTYLLRKALKKVQNENGYLPFQIIVREDFQLSGVIDILTTAVEECRKVSSASGLALAIRFSFGYCSSKDKSKWVFLFRVVNRMLFSIIEMKCLEDDRDSGHIIVLPHHLPVHIFIELPPQDIFPAETTDGKPWFKSSTFLPCLGSKYVENVDCEHAQFVLENDATEIAKYLKAYEDSTIDYQFTGERKENLDVLFLLDASGSMPNNHRWDPCTTSVMKVCEVLLPEDRAGLIVFHSKVETVWKLNSCSKSNIEQLKTRMDSVCYDEASKIYSGLIECLEEHTKHYSESRKQFIIALSDGGVNNDDYAKCRERFKRFGNSISVIFIAIDVRERYKKQICDIIEPSVKDLIWIEAKDTEKGIASAFKDAENSLTVNQKIHENAKDITDDNIRTLIEKYMQPSAGTKWTRVQKAMWIRYMHRRCCILASSTKFNKNVNLPHYGSLTMKMMLMEAELAVKNKHISWEDSPQEHMVYREVVIKKEDNSVSEEVDYQWSILALNQEKDSNWEEKAQLLGKLDMYVPRPEDLSNARVLESYLAYAIDAELVFDDPSTPNEHEEEQKFDFPLGRIQEIKQQRFILTLDFLMKMLLINERIKCQVPCIIMGETGVSKTRVTKTLFSLKNARVKNSNERKMKLSEILEISSKSSGDRYHCLRHLCEWLRIPFSPLRGDSSEKSLFSSCATDSNFLETVAAVVLSVFKDDPSLDPLEDLPIGCLKNISSKTEGPENVCKIIEWLLKQDFVTRKAQESSWMFTTFNIHATVSASEIRFMVRNLAARVERIHQLGREIPTFFSHQRAEVCLFFDEFNTTSCMGMLKEIIVDHSLDGEDLPAALVPIAACNPFREKKNVHQSERLLDHGQEWVSGHYHVERLPKTIKDMTFDFGSLNPSQEKEFVLKALLLEDLPAEKDLTGHIVEAVCAAHTATKKLAVKHLELWGLENKAVYSTEDIKERAASSVSLRDILRFFRFFRFFRTGLNSYIQKMLFPATHNMNDPDAIKEVLTLSIAFVYYFRFTSDKCESMNFRKQFAQEMNKKSLDIERVVERCIEIVVDHTKVDPGIVKTKSLSENIFVILFCIASRTPLILKGPPGTSKTLAVRILCNNAHENFSHNEFYKSLPGLSPLHYQCTRSSSATEISDVFEKALKSQKSSDMHGAGHTIFFVFMDEAGLPEEERESLKVLHYYLESSYERATEVGFIGLTNQLLDTAKSNRCIMLSRVQYSEVELEELAFGYIDLCEERRKEELLNSSLKLPGGATISLKKAIPLICKQFEKFTSQRNAKLLSQLDSRREAEDESTFSENCTDFFSFRDVMHFFKLFGRVASSVVSIDGISVSHLTYCFQRNFNGLESFELLSLMGCILKDILPPIRFPEKILLNPVELLRRSLQEKEYQNGLPACRYVLACDTTNSDGVLRALQGRLNANGMNLNQIRISRYPETMEKEQTEALSEIQWRMNRGDAIILVHAAPIHESLYDPLNQHFQVRERLQTKEKYLQTNIAIGSLSVECDVKPSFRCIIFLNSSELNAAPAAFLDRLEKYSLNMAHILHEYLLHRPRDDLWNALQYVVDPLYKFVSRFVEIESGTGSFYGIKKFQSVESAILCLLTRWEEKSAVNHDICDNWPYLRTIFSSLPSTTSLKEINEWLNDHLCNTLTAADLLHYVLLQTAQREVLKLFFSIAVPENIILCLTTHLELAELYLDPKQFSFFPTENTSSCHLINYGSRELIYTRAVSKEFYKLLEENTKKISFLNLESVSSSRFELEDKVKEMWTNFSHLVLYMELSSSNVAHLNFIRDYVDLLYRRNSDEKKRITQIIVLIPSLDFTTNQTYDAVFSCEWKLRFSDVVGEEETLLPWLYFSLKKNDISLHGDSAENLFRDIFTVSLANSVQLLAGKLRVTFPFSEKLDEYVHPDTILATVGRNVCTEGKEQTISDLILDFWRKKNNEDICTTAQNVIKNYSEFHHFESLTQAIKTELCDLLARIVLMVVTEFLPCFPETFGGQQEENARCESAATVWDVFTLLTDQDLQILLKPLSKCQRISISPNRNFPFYDKVFDFLRKFVSQVVGANSQSIESIEWDSLLSACEEDSRKTTGETLSTQAAKKALAFDKASPLFYRYVANTVAHYVPECSAATQHHSIEWLISHITPSSVVPSIIQIHLLYCQKGHHFFETVRRIERIRLTLPEDSHFISLCRDPTSFNTKLTAISKSYSFVDGEYTPPTFIALLSKLLYGSLPGIAALSCSSSSPHSELVFLIILREVYLAATDYGANPLISFPCTAVGSRISCLYDLQSIIDEIYKIGVVPFDQGNLRSIKNVLNKYFSSQSFSVLLRIVAKHEKLWLVFEKSSFLSEMTNKKDIAFMVTILTRHKASGSPLFTFCSAASFFQVLFPATSFLEQIDNIDSTTIYEILLPWLSNDSTSTNHNADYNEKVKIIFLFVWIWLLLWIEESEEIEFSDSLILKILDLIEQFYAFEKSVDRCLVVLALKHILIFVLAEYINSCCVDVLSKSKSGEQAVQVILRPLCVETKEIEKNTWSTILNSFFLNTQDPKEFQRKWPVISWIQPIFKGVSNTVKSNSSLFPAFPTLHTVRYTRQKIEELFRWEINLVALSRHLWILPFLKDFSRWFFADNEIEKSTLLQVSDSYRRNQWNLLKAGVKEAKATHCELTSLPDLPECQKFDGNSKHLLEEVFTIFLSVYRSMLEEGYKTKNLTRDLPNVANLDDFFNILGGNEAFIAELPMILNADGSSSTSAERAVYCQRHSFQVANPIINLLTALHVFFLLDSAPPTTNHFMIEATSTEIHYFFSHTLVSISNNFAHNTLLLTSEFYDFPSCFQSDERRLGFLLRQADLKELFHSFTFYSLKQINSVLVSAKDAFLEENCSLKDLRAFVLRWMGGSLPSVPLEKQTLEEWFSSFIGFYDSRTCNTILSFDRQNTMEACTFVEKELRLQWFLFRDKPIEVKVELEDWVSKKLKDVWKDTPTKELHDLLCFVRSQEKNVIHQAKEEDGKQNLISTIGSDFSSEIKVFQHFPCLRRIEDALSNESSASLSSLLCCHYVAVILSLQGALHDRRKTKQKMCSSKHVRVAATPQNNSWSFLLHDELSEQRFQDYKDNQKTLKRGLDRFNDSLESVKAIEKSLEPFSVHDTSRVVKEARKLTENFRKKEKILRESISLFIDANAAKEETIITEVNTESIPESIRKPEKELLKDYAKEYEATEELKKNLTSVPSAQPLWTIYSQSPQQEFDELEESLSKSPELIRYVTW